MIEKKLAFFVFIFVVNIVAQPFFDERSEKLTALKVAEEPEETPEEIQTGEENDEASVEATLGPDSENEDSDSDLAQPDDPEIVKAKKERKKKKNKRKSKKKNKKETKNSDHENGDDMNVDPFIQGANPQEYSTIKHVDPFPYTMSEEPTAYSMSSSTEGPSGYKDDDNENDDNNDEDDDSGPNAYTASTSTEGPQEYTANTHDDDSGPNAYTESTSTGPSGYTDDDNKGNDNDGVNNDETDGTSDVDDSKVNILLSVEV